MPFFDPKSQPKSQPNHNHSATPSNDSYERASRFMCRKLKIDPDANDWMPPLTPLQEGDPLVPVSFANHNWGRMSELIHGVFSIRDEQLFKNGRMKKSARFRWNEKTGKLELWTPEGNIKPDKHQLVEEVERLRSILRYVDKFLSSIEGHGYGGELAFDMLAQMVKEEVR